MALMFSGAVVAALETDTWPAGEAAGALSNLSVIVTALR
ncbi:hypothetical protein SBADM41S_09153 [Streptomyces badius]